MRPSLYEFAGGADAFRRLADAHHARCLADPELNHPFSHDGLNPEHVDRLARYWSAVLGGPDAPDVDHAAMLLMHAHNGDMGDLGQRFARCFAAAMDDARLPEDPAFRAAMNAYMRWAVADVLQYGPPETVVRPDTRAPRWDWDGLRA